MIRRRRPRAAQQVTAMRPRRRTGTGKAARVAPVKAVKPK